MILHETVLMMINNILFSLSKSISELTLLPVLIWSDITAHAEEDYKGLAT